MVARRELVRPDLRKGTAAIATAIVIARSSTIIMSCSDPPLGGKHAIVRARWPLLLRLGHEATCSRIEGGGDYDDGRSGSKGRRVRVERGARILRLAILSDDQVGAGAVPPFTRIQFTGAHRVHCARSVEMIGVARPPFQWQKVVF